MTNIPAIARAGTLLLLLALAFVALTQPAAAETAITIAGSDPRANDVLADPPEQISVTFSIAVDPGASQVRLIGADGRAPDGMAITWNAPDTVEIEPSSALADGSWLVAWDVTAAGGDASGSGFFGFTIGIDQDVAPLTLPHTGFASAGGSAWLAAAGGAILLLGVCLLAATMPLRMLSLAGGTLLERMAVAGAALAVTGALAWLAALAWDDPHASWDGRLRSGLDDPTGGLLLALLVLVSLHSLALTLTDRRPAWATTLVLPIPLVLLSHAADEPAGRLTALTVAWLAIAALALLIGGAIVRLGSAPGGAGRWPLAVATALPVLAGVGAYLLWLFGGNRAAIESTTYGQVATVAVVLFAGFALMLVVATILGRRSAPRWGYAIPVVLGIALVACTGSLMTIDTARAEMVREASQRTLPLTLGDHRAQLILAPGKAGVNHVRLEVDRASIPRLTTAELTMTLPSHPDLGAQTVTLARVSGTAFEYHGTEMVIADRWDLTVRLSEPGHPPGTATTEIDLAAGAARVEPPAVPWRFTDFAGSTAMVMIAIGIAGVMIGIAAGRSPLRMESAGIGIGALVLAAILLGQGRLDPILARGGAGDGGAINPDDLTAITRGEEVYATYCLSCHGAELRGDGPAATGLQPPPADFSAPHTRAHDESTLIYWVRNGKQGSAMPAFGDKLTDEQIAEVLSYIAREQREMDTATPMP